MKATVSQPYRLYRRANGIYYAEAVANGRQTSLRTRDPEEATRLLHARNEAGRDARVAREVGLAYLATADPEARTRTWRWVLDQLVTARTGDTRRRWETAGRDPALRELLPLVVHDTRAEHLLAALRRGTVSTNVYLRRLHNAALDFGWLGRAVIVRRQWPAVKHRRRRDITAEEHARIHAAEGNAERRDFYELLWLVGASQGDAARLTAEDIDWRRRELRFFRAKTGRVVCQRFGPAVEALLRRRPEQGQLFPYLAGVRSADRATEFGQRCSRLGIKGVSLHSYRYSWARRAKRAGYPERFAQLALGRTTAGPSTNTTRAWRRPASPRWRNLRCWPPTWCPGQRWRHQPRRRRRPAPARPPATTPSVAGRTGRGPPASARSLRGRMV